jgi:molybdenum cofactor synthesis domain-containing protein
MGSTELESSKDTKLRIGILTVSDRSSKGERDDLSGPAIQKVAEKHGFDVTQYAIVPDEIEKISETLKTWADQNLCDCILTTGGTGLSKRDVTPEATELVLERQLPHLATEIAMTGADHVPTAVLSRALAGTRGKTLIVNLPGSVNGAREGAEIVFSVAKHAVDVLHEQGDKGH